MSSSYLRSLNSTHISPNWLISATRLQFMDYFNLEILFTNSYIVRIKLLKAWHDVTFLWIYYYLINIPIFHLFYLFHCTWLEYIRSCTKYSSYEFLTKRWFVNNQSIDLGNPFEVIVHNFLIRRMIGLSYRNEFSMMNALVCLTTFMQQLCFEKS